MMGVTTVKVRNQETRASKRSRAAALRVDSGAVCAVAGGKGTMRRN